MLFVITLWGSEEFFHDAVVHVAVDVDRRLGPQVVFPHHLVHRNLVPVERLQSCLWFRNVLLRQGHEFVTVLISKDLVLGV